MDNSLDDVVYEPFAGAIARLLGLARDARIDDATLELVIDAIRLAEDLRELVGGTASLLRSTGGDQAADALEEYYCACTALCGQRLSIVAGPPRK